MPLLKEHNAVIVLIGTRCDLREDKEAMSRLKEKNITPITYEMGNELARKLSAVAYMECSSLMKVGTKEIFDKAITATVLKKKSTSILISSPIYLHRRTR